MLDILLSYTTDQGRIQEFVQGGGLNFFSFFPFQVGGEAPVGGQKPSENHRFHWLRGGGGYPNSSLHEYASATG